MKLGIEKTVMDHNGEARFFFFKGCKDRLSKFLNYVVKLVAKTKGL